MLAGRHQPPTDQIELALRYAYMFFLRMCVPFPAVREAQDGTDAVTAMSTTPEAIVSGVDPYLDLVCDPILDGGEFLVPEELVTPPDHTTKAGE